MKLHKTTIRERIEDSINNMMGKKDGLTSLIEGLEAMEGIYHGVEGCNDPSHGHPVNLKETQ